MWRHLATPRPAPHHLRVARFSPLPPSSLSCDMPFRDERSATVEALASGRVGRGMDAAALATGNESTRRRTDTYRPEEAPMTRIVDLSMTVEECDSAPFAKEELYFKLRPIVRWEDKGFVSNMVEMTVHAGTHIDSPHHFFRDKPSVEQLPLEPLIAEAVVLELSFKGTPNARITPEDMDRAEAALNAQGITIQPNGMLFLRTD